MAEGRGRKLIFAIAVVAVIVSAFFVTASQADPVFAPTISLETSTTRATAHPDARITIDNSGSTENIKDLTLTLPDGFWGSIGAVPYKCTESEATTGTCPADTKIGTVTASADIEDPDTGTMVDGVLSGNVYLTEAFTGNNDPAGVSILVHAKVGGVDLGNVIINGRAITNVNKPVGFPGPANGEIKGLKTIVNDIPQSITDTANTPNRTVDYKVDKMQIDLISDLQDPANPDPTWGYMPPLLTNPSKCDTYTISATATPYGGGSDVTFTDNYVVDQCDTARFNPTSTTFFANTDVDGKIPAGSDQAVYSSVSFPASTTQPDSNSSLNEMTVYLPRGMGANFDAFGQPGDMCSGGSIGIAGGKRWFNAALCPGASLIGLAYITTPLLATGQTLYAEVYAINTTPVPSLGLVVTGGNYGNPLGIDFSAVGMADLYKNDPDCTVSPCDSRIGIKFSDLPDAPITAIDVQLDPGEVRTSAIPPYAALSGKFITQADQGASNCQENNDVVAVMTASSGGTRGSVNSYETTCAGNTIHPSTGPWGEVTDDTTPTFDFTYSGVASELYCGIDGIYSAAKRTACKTSLTHTPSSALGNGAHNVIVGDGLAPSYLGSKSLVRDFVVQPDLTYDDVVPTTTLSAGPGTPGPDVGETADSTPSFTFNASETSAFQCSLDGAAFLPCGDATGTADESYEIPVAESLPASDTVHTFEVRAQDTAGNVDLTPEKASFKIVKPFDPQIDIDLTTYEARKHPEMTVTIDNPSHEDIKDLQLNLPDGFFGGLTGVQSLCSIAAADSGTCGAGSQVGTVEATALIDRSTAYIKGKVYLTETRTIGDPAGLTIEVLPKLQGVTFKPVRINARLSVRGEGEGVNTAAINIPNTAESTIDEVSEFDVHQMVIKLKDNPAAPKSLLTNPSGCDAKSFAASFTGYDDSTDTASVPFQATNCASLGFAPQLSISAVERSTGGPPAPSDNIKRATVDLTASMTADPNGAGVKNVALTLPSALTIDVQRLPTACQPDQQAAKACPASSAIGTVSVVTPLLPEVLEGTIYVLKPTTGLPRLLIALRGRINVDIVANNKYTGPKFNIVQTTFDTVPDVPITSFTMKVNGFLTTWEDACTTERSSGNPNYSGTLGAYNGASSPVSIPQAFDCPPAGPTVSIKWVNKGKKSTLTESYKAESGKKIKKITLKLPKGVSFINAGFSKKKIAKLVIVKGDKKKLKTKCFKKKSSNTFEINFCGKKVSTASVQFKAGTINSKTKKKGLKFVSTIVDAANAKKTVTKVSK